MTVILIILTVATLAMGVTSACFWYKSSKVMVMPMVNVNGRLELLSVEHNHTEWIRALYQGIEKTGSLNKKAAISTAIAVSLSVITTLISVTYNSMT